MKEKKSRPAIVEYLKKVASLANDD